MNYRTYPTSQLLRPWEKSCREKKLTRWSIQHQRQDRRKRFRHTAMPFPSTSRRSLPHLAARYTRKWEPSCYTRLCKPQKHSPTVSPCDRIWTRWFCPSCVHFTLPAQSELMWPRTFPHDGDPVSIQQRLRLRSFRSGTAPFGPHHSYTSLSFYSCSFLKIHPLGQTLFDA